MDLWYHRVSSAILSWYCSNSISNITNESTYFCQTYAVTLTWPDTVTLKCTKAVFQCKIHRCQFFIKTNFVLKIFLTVLQTVNSFTKQTPYNTQLRATEMSTVDCT